MELERKQRQVLDGVVISDKNNKTITVLVETHKRHKYGKRVKYRKNITRMMKTMKQKKAIQFALWQLVLLVLLSAGA